jgi:hypothetical protein
VVPCLQLEQSVPVAFWYMIADNGSGGVPLTRFEITVLNFPRQRREWS